MIRRCATAFLLVIGLLILLAEVDEHDAHSQEVARKQEINWRK